MVFLIVFISDYSSTTLSFTESGNCKATMEEDAALLYLIV